MLSPYELITISESDLQQFQEDYERSKIAKLIFLVLSDLPPRLKAYERFITPYLREIDGFEDRENKGYEIIVENKDIENHIKKYIPFIILKKES